MCLSMVTWTPKVCRIIAFYRFWAIILPTFGGPGRNETSVRMLQGTSQGASIFSSVGL